MCSFRLSQQLTLVLWQLLHTADVFESVAPTDNSMIKELSVDRRTELIFPSSLSIPSHDVQKQFSLVLRHLLLSLFHSQGYERLHQVTRWSNCSLNEKYAWLANIERGVYGSM
jgi:hypothetical protein